MLTILLQTQTVEGLTTEGWLVMLTSVSMVLGLAGFCMVKILSERSPAETHHAPLDIDTHDLHEP